MKTWFITGCSVGGLGEGMARAVLARGDQAVITAQSLAKLDPIVQDYPDRVLPIAMDITKQEDIDRAVSAAMERFGRIDTLINNAGYAYRCAVEEGERSGIGRIYATNLFGPLALIRKVLPIMRGQGAGAIVSVSSISAYNSGKGSAFYASTKAALELLTDGLKKEVEPLGIKVMIVEPGAFDTNFHRGSLKQSDTMIEAYKDTWANRPGQHDMKGKNLYGDPMKGGRIVVDVISGEEYPLRLYLGSDAVDIIEKSLLQRLEELRKWKDVSIQSDK